ncbi:MAG: tRNA (guanosine(46)-N7)-methyltransferase TrmB [Limisphaerales bacterium]
MQPQFPYTQGALIHKFESILDPLNLANLYPQQQPTELELGAGDGSFLVQYAKLHPEHNFLGLERLLGRLRKIDKKSQRAGLQNVKLVRIEASYFLRYLLPEKSITAIHVYFPDPWPKRKHRKNRLVNEEFTELARRVLVSNGIIHLRTDDVDYFQQMNRVFDANPAFEKIEPPEALLQVRTDFERNFHLRGVPTQAVSYRSK